jgi:serine O-acetyltransferase
VSLGGTSLDKGKRHPTLEDSVIVGAGARVLGPVTVGAGARIGANAVVLVDVPKGVTMVGVPAHVVMRKNRDQKFQAYGVDPSIPDPMIRAIDELRNEVARLQDRLNALENQGDAPVARGTHAVESASDDEPHAQARGQR